MSRTSESRGLGKPEDRDVLRVLVLDDESLMRNLIGEILSGIGCHVRGAQDGCEALQIIAQEPTYDVVTVDMRMPGMGGGEFMRRLRLDVLPEKRPVPVVVAALDPDDPERAEIGHAFDVLTKPFSVRRLLAVVLAAGEHARARCDSDYRRLTTPA